MKKNVLIVGSFKNDNNGGSGGQLFACKTMVESKLSDTINWIKIDSTIPHNMGLPMSERIWKGLSRVILALKAILFKKVDSLFIFTGDGYSFYEKGLIALIGKTFGKKVIIAPRSGYVRNNLENGGFLQKYIVYVLRRVDHVICQGQSWKTLFLRYTKDSEEKYEVIKNWLDLNQYTGVEIKGDKPIFKILFLGWIDELKGIFDLVEASKKVSEFLNVQFIIAGDGKDRKRMEEMVQQNNLQSFFLFKGWVSFPEKISLMKECSIHILPSYTEGMSNSLLEAMAMGLPSIASNVGGIPDVINHGENGFLIEPGKPDEIADHIFLLYNDVVLRKEISRNAAVTIRQEHNLENAINHLKQLL